MKKAFSFLKSIFLRMREHDVAALGAAFAYRMLLALFPFLFFLATLASYMPLTGREALAELAAVVPPAALRVVRDALEEIAQTNRTNLLSLSALVMIWFASDGFLALAEGIERAYGTKQARGTLRVRAVSLLFVPLIALGVLLETAAVVFGSIFVRKLAAALGLSLRSVSFLHALRFVLPSLLLVFLFALLYAVVPKKRLAFRQALPGAAFASAAWALSSLAFSFYVERFADYARFYGSLGGIMILLVWLYLTSVVLLIGAQINGELLARQAGGAPR